jgi:GAF domain-containing protein
MASRRTTSTAAPGRTAAGRAGALAVGLLIVGALAVFDALVPGTVVIGTVVLAPFVVSVLAGPDETALVAVVAVAVVLVSASWNDNFLAASYLLRVVVVVGGGAVAVLAARGRRDTAVDRERFALLAAVAEAADGHLSLEETAARLSELIVPWFADVSVLDVLRDGRLRRLAVKAAGPDAAAHETWLRAREPSASDLPAAGETVASGRARLLHPATDAILRAGAREDSDLERLGELRIAAAIFVPLRARGRNLGALTLMTRRDSRRAYAVEDLEFVEVLAGRAALALDNAGLFTELQTIEAQLTTALGSLADAVTVQNRQGNLVYANEAAAGLLGFASARELVATPATDVAAGFDAFREDGSPLDIADLPGRRVLAGEDPAEPLIVRAVNRRTNEEQWRLTKASAVRDSSGEVTLVVNVITDITAAKRAELSQRVLAEAGEALASSLDYERTLQQVADLAVPGLADWCAVSLPDDRGGLTTVAVAHVDPAKVSLARAIGAEHPTSLDEPGGAAQVFRDGTPTSVNGITDEMLVAAAQDGAHLEGLRSLGMRAALIVPMTSSGRSVGVLSLVSAESGRSFGPEDVALAAELARRAATAVENARLYTERSTIARILQASLLPDELPELPGWTAATLYRPAGDETSVGGDFYEGFAIAGGWMLVVGDVTGRGAEAASLTALMRHTLRTAATLTDSAAAALAALNRSLRSRPEMSLCTAVCVVLREVDGRAQAEITCAGHPLPLRVRAGRPEHVGRFGAILGAYDGEAWEPVSVELADGDVLVLFSDGVLDAVGRRDRFGPERLERSLAGAATAADAVNRIAAALDDFQVGKQADDTAILAVEREPVAALGAATPAKGEASAD